MRGKQKDNRPGDPRATKLERASYPFLYLL